MDGIAAIGFRLSADKQVDFHLLTTYNDTDDILTDNGKILVFREFDLCKEAFSFFDEMIKADFAPPSEIAMVCDVVEALRLIRAGKTDKSSIILNCLNTFFDAFRAVDLKIPGQYKKLLFDLANYLTFEKKIEPFFVYSKVSRDVAFDAFSWCVDNFISSVTFLEDR